MRSVQSAIKKTVTVQEMRCPKCGNQLVRSELHIEGEPFDIDPFQNFVQLQARASQDQMQSAELADPNLQTRS
ncbi:MAG: hypothetical protein AAF434_16055 [Pseudomonadota bacterium]